MSKNQGISFPMWFIIYNYSSYLFGRIRIPKRMLCENLSKTLVCPTAILCLSSQKIRGHKQNHLYLLKLGGENLMKNRMITLSDHLPTRYLPTNYKQNSNECGETQRHHFDQVVKVKTISNGTNGYHVCPDIMYGEDTT